MDETGQELLLPLLLGPLKVNTGNSRP